MGILLIAIGLCVFMLLNKKYSPIILCPPAQKTKEDRYFLPVFLIFIFLHFFLIFTRRIYPFVDLPFHLSAATILKFYKDPTTQFAQYFSIHPFLKPNIFDMFFFSLPIFPSVEFGSRVFYGLYVILLPLSILCVVKKVQGNPWFVLLAFLFLYNFNLCWGFVGFTIFIPAFFFWVYFFLKYLERDSMGNKFMVGTGLLLLYFIHLLGALFALLVFFVCIIAKYRKSILRLLQESIMAIPVLALIVLYRKVTDGLSIVEFLIMYYKKYYVHTFAYRFMHLLIADNCFLYNGILGESIALFFSVFVLFFVLSAMASKWRSLTDYFKTSPIVVVQFLRLITVCVLFCYAFLPSDLPGIYFLYQRFANILFLLFIILSSVAPCRTSLGIKKNIIVVMCLICTAHFVLWARCFNNFEQENKNFNKDIFPCDTQNKNLNGLIYNYHFRGFPAYIHYPSYYMIWCQGISSTCLTQYEYYNVIQSGKDKIYLPYYNEWIGRDKKFNRECLYADYILVRGCIPAVDYEYLKKRFVINKSKGEWSLYIRKIPVPRNIDVFDRRLLRMR